MHKIHLFRRLMRHTRGFLKPPQLTLQLLLQKTLRILRLHRVRLELPIRPLIQGRVQRRPFPLPRRPFLPIFLLCLFPLFSSRLGIIHRGRRSRLRHFRLRLSFLVLFARRVSQNVHPSVFLHELLLVDFLEQKEVIRLAQFLAFAGFL